MIDSLLVLLAPVLGAYAGEHGWVVQVLSIMGTLRLVVKPLMTIVQSVVAATPSTKDDETVAKVAASPYYTWFVYALDWFASIKVQPKA